MINVTKLLCGSPQPADALRYGEGADAPAQASLRKPVVVWNITRRCNLKCVHCYSDSTSRHYPGELTLEQSIRVIDDLAHYQVPALLLSGGEPMIHPRFFDLASYAVSRGIRVTVSTNGTRIDSSAAVRLKDLGITYVGISLDGIGPVHDKFRGRTGAFQKAVEAFRHCRGAGQKVGLRLTLTRQTVGQLAEILSFIEKEEIPRVCFYHLVSSGRGADLGLLPAAESRAALRMIGDAVVRWNRDGIHREVLTVDQPADGPFYWMLARRRNPERADEIWKLLEWNGGGRHASGLGISNIDSQGNVHPDQFWQTYTLGNVKRKAFSEIWDNGRNDPLLSGLRDRLPRLEGRCASCRFQEVCGGGFRVRAFQKYGNPWAEDPGCYLRDYEILRPSGTAAENQRSRQRPSPTLRTSMRTGVRPAL
ncbi:MAG: radical SAM protein [Terrimicrobiaceae bacterium]